MNSMLFMLLFAGGYVALAVFIVWNSKLRSAKVNLTAAARHYEDLSRRAIDGWANCYNSTISDLPCETCWFRAIIGNIPREDIEAYIGDLENDSWEATNKQQLDEIGRSVDLLRLSLTQLNSDSKEDIDGK